MIRFLAISGLLLSAATPALAVDDSATQTLTVHFSDLDLARPADAKMLRRRIAWAVREICGSPRADDLTALRMSNECSAAAMQRAEPQIAEAMENGQRLAARRTAVEVASR